MSTEAEAVSGGKDTVMRRTAFMFTVTLVVGIGLGLLAAQFLYAQPEGIKRTLLLRTECNALHVE